MKKWLILGALIAINCCANDEEVFLKAYRCYNNKEYTKALELYQSIPNKGSAIWYNMGNCAYHVHDYVHAHLYWKQAERHASSQQAADIAYNLDVLDAKMGKEPRSTYSWSVLLARYGSTLSLRMWQILFLFCWCMALLLQRKRLLPGKTVALLCLCGMVLSGVGMRFRYVQNNKKIAMVTMQEAALYAGPDSRYELLGKVSMMSEVTVQEMRERWCKVLHQTTVGWMSNDSLAVV